MLLQQSNIHKCIWDQSKHYDEAFLHFTVLLSKIDYPYKLQKTVTRRKVRLLCLSLIYVFTYFGLIKSFKHFSFLFHSLKVKKLLNFYIVVLLILNLFLVSVPILYLLKTPENQRFTVFFRGYNKNICQKWINSNHHI